MLVRRRDAQGKWNEPVAIDDGNLDHYSPTITRYGQGALAVWSGQVDGNFELYTSQIGPDGKTSKPVRLTNAPFSDINARMITDAKGDVTLVWQSFRNGNSGIYLRRFSGKKWGPEIQVSADKANDWEPDVAVTPQGLAWISWDSYQNGNYDVLLRSFDGRALGETVAITTEPSAQFHSSIAVDNTGRVWVAGDDSGINWGKDFSRASSVEGSRGLHFSRKLGMRAYANGRVQEVSADLGKVLTGRMARYAELPHLSFDASGALCLVFRHRTEIRPNEIYHFYARRLTGGKMPGTEFTAPLSHSPRIEASIQALDEILRIDVVKNGKYVFTTRPGGKTATISWRDNEPRPGKSYYYVRVFQRDPENPEGDPEIAWWSPFYVAYK